MYYTVIRHHTDRRKTREIYFLLWDEENEEHLAEHSVTPAEVRQMLSNRHLTMPNPRAEGRITLIGATNGGRILSVALDPTGDSGTWRPVTAIPAPSEDLDFSTITADDPREADHKERMKGAMTEKQDIQVHEGRRTGVVVSVRLKPHEADLLEALAERDGRTLSETLRVALHSLATSPGAGRKMALQGEELSLVTRGEWDERRVELELA